MDKISVQVSFSKKTESGVEFNDALYFSLEEFANVSEKDLENLKNKRFNKWEEDILTALLHEPTKEELEKQKIDLEEGIASLEARKQELTILIATK